MILKREENQELYAKVDLAFDKYIKETVGKPNPVFGGMPPCPFAKAEWMKGKIDIVICDIVEALYESEDGDDRGLLEIMDLMYVFNENFKKDQRKSTLILVDKDQIEANTINVSDGVDLAYELELAYKECYPYETDDDSLDILTSNPIEPTVWGELTPYFSILVQNSEFLAKAIKVLAKAGYYKNLKKDDIVEGIADDPVYKGIEFTDGKGLGNDFRHHPAIQEDNDLYDQINKE